MMGRASAKKGKKSDENLADLVLSWKLEDVFNEDLYKDKVEKIPESFQSVKHYFGSYMFPLMEETRTELCTSMDVISEAPFAEIFSIAESKPYGSLLYDIKVDFWRNKFGSGGKEPYKPKPGDILVLSDLIPETVSELQQSGRSWTFASVIKVADNEHSQMHFKVEENGDSPMKIKASKAIEVKKGMQNLLFAIFLINLTTNNRIWIALQMLGNLKIIKEILCNSTLIEESCNVCSSLQLNGIWAKSFGGDLSSKLNKSQTGAVLSAISTVYCNHKSSVKLIWGPPGTGKTKTISTMLWTLLKINCRSLACAPTNVAIKEVASRVLKLVKESLQTESGECISCCSLGNLLLFGNKDRLEVVDDLEEIFLDYRVDRLVECFGRLTGWKKCFASMIDFLEKCALQYQTYLENESSKVHEACKENETSEGVLTFLQFTRKLFREIASPLGKCVRTLCTHLPKGLILEQNFKDMASLIDLLESFKNLLFHDNVVATDLEELFSHSENAVNYFGYEVVHCFTSIELYKTRNRCLHILKSLQNSLVDIGLPHFMNKGSIREFCFQNASLIFCTASSSFKLHSLVMAPLDLLVIDEAAQLKEGESAIPLQLPGIRHVILIGDEHQLPAMVNSKVASEAGFGRSLFERLSLLGHPKHLLNMQYRMHPKISFFPNAKFYLNQIVDAPRVKDKSYGRRYLPGPMYGPYSFINISDGREVFDDVGHSRKNMVEVAVIIKILRNLFKAWVASKHQLSIGIVTPYNAQVAAIRGKLGRKYENCSGFDVRVKSIDGFQGGEEDIIIISTVRSNSGGSIGFLSNSQRTNVAITRAKHCLWILGNEKTLINSGSVWAELVHNAKDRQCFFNADADKDLAKAILQVKQELDHLDDLLEGDSILFKSTRWKLLFFDSFKKSFGKLMSVGTKKTVIDLLLKLSGGWRPKKKNVDFICEGSSQLVKQFKVENLFIVCTVDILEYTQVLRIWDILPLKEIPKLVKDLDNIFVMFTDDFVNRCKMKCFDGVLEVPMSWDISDHIVRYKNICKMDPGKGSSDETFDGRSYVENSRVSEIVLLMKLLSLSSGVVGHLHSGHDGREVDLPFEVSDQVRDVIAYPRSTFILGSSGTGKTTVLTMKLSQKENQHYLCSEGLSKVKGDTSMDVHKRNELVEDLGKTRGTVLRQLFVTVSPMLCSAVKKQISQLKSFTHGGNFSEANMIDMHDIDDTTVFMDIPNHLIDIPPSSYPLVLTFRKFLMMLDASMENSYFDKLHGVKELSQGKTGMSRSVALQAVIRTKEVNYDRFNSFYWPHFDVHLTKQLNSFTVFTEIISHIKGGLGAARACDGKLSRGDYVVLSEGQVSSLSRERREIIYEIFLDYEKKKVMNGEFDMADLVIDLHRRLKDGSYEGEEMDFVYIDEVQDLAMSQIALFKYICRNFPEGFVFAGDTAQTIANGTDFKFQDIRSLFYKEFLLESGGDRKDRAKEKGQPCISDIFNLSHNFHTHTGVLNLAQSVIDLCFRFFPLSIDVLSPETSLINGEAPVLLEFGNDENAIITMFGNSKTHGGSMIGFGAEQVILVRDDSARKEISYHVGKKALVLTLVECKGLKFQDVLLYNFFGTSPLKNQWRVVYEYMEEQDMLDSTAPRSFPCFDKAKHNALCSELKQLYVAITCTRQRLWICEKKQEFSRPMFDYWKKLCLVKVRQLDNSLAQVMQVASSKEEWSLCGIKLFNVGNFEMATMCFERAGDTYRKEWAKAAGLRAAADRIHGSNSEMRRIALMEAAEIYETIGRAESAANCFIELKEFKRAGEEIVVYPKDFPASLLDHIKKDADFWMIYLEKCGESRLEDAGDCFSLVGCWNLAAEVYARGNYFFKCLSVCTSKGLFDLGLNFIKCWKEKSTPSVGKVAASLEWDKMEQSFLEKCVIHYHELKDTKTMMTFIRDFLSMDSIRTFLRSWDYLDELVLLEEEPVKFLEAASIARLKGDLLLEADMLGRAGHFEDASKLILSYVVGNSLWGPGSKGWPLKHFTHKEELLMKAKLIAKKKSDFFYESVCMEASILLNKETNLLHMEQYLSASRRFKSLQAKFFSARKILDLHLQLEPSEYVWEQEVVLDLMKHAEDTICRNHVSVESLIYFWNIWRGTIVNMSEFLQSLESHHENEYMNHGQFCLDYFGVRKQENGCNSTYLLVNSDAYWVKVIDERSLQRNGNLVSVDLSQFVSAAQSYWCSELFFVGIKVLESLEALHKFSNQYSFPIFFQSMVVLYIFEVTQFLMESELLDRKYCARYLQKFLTLSKEHFFDNVFPLDWRQTMTENMVALRGTSLFRDFLTHIITENINLKGKLTHGQIGRVVMLILVSAKLTDKMYQKIANRFDVSPPWKAFIEQLKETMGSGFGQMSLVCKFQHALGYTFSVNWKNEADYISPHCYVYLVERLLYWVSSCQAYFFTTKSSIVETLTCQEWYDIFSTRSVTDVHASLGGLYDFIARQIEQLLFGKQGTLEWLKKSNFTIMDYCPLLMLRLVIMISLICLNSGRYFGLLSKLLGKNEISSQLPKAFYKILQGWQQYNFHNVLAKAFRTIGNPLVVLTSGFNCPQQFCSDTLVINMEVIQCREDVLRVMFPKNIDDAQSQVRCNELETKNTSSMNLSSGQTNQGSRAELPSCSVLAGGPDQDMQMEIENEDSDLQKTYGHFWETIDVLESGEHRNYGKGRSIPFNAAQIKMEVKESICIIDAAIAQLIRRNICQNKDENLFPEAKGMLDELKQLSIALELSDQEHENTISALGELLRRLRKRRPRLESLLDSLFSHNNTSALLEESQNSVASGIQKNCNKKNIDNMGEGNTKSKWVTKASQASVASGTQNISNKEKENDMVKGNTEPKKKKASQASVASGTQNISNKEKENDMVKGNTEPKKKKASQTSVESGTQTISNKEKENDMVKGNTEPKKKKAAQASVASGTQIISNKEKENDMVKGNTEFRKKKASQTSVESGTQNVSNKEKENDMVKGNTEPKKKKAAQASVASGTQIISNKEKENDMVKGNTEPKKKKAAQASVASGTQTISNKEKENDMVKRNSEPKRMTWERKK